MELEGRAKHVEREARGIDQNTRHSQRLMKNDDGRRRKQTRQPEQLLRAQIDGHFLNEQRTDGR